MRSRARVFCLFQFDWLFYRDLVSEIVPAIVHGWGTEDGYGLSAIRLAPKTHVVEVQGLLNAYRRRVSMPWVTAVAGLSERMALARAKHVVAENEYSLSAAHELTRHASMHVIEHPIRQEFLQSNPAFGDAKQILFLGAIEERKGIWDALQAFRDAAPSDWRLVIVGKGRQEATKRMEKQIAEYELSERVSHYPQLSTAEIVTIMQASSVLLLPTRIDTGPTALKESMAMGLWPVCYDNSGPAHYIRRFNFGELAADLDLRALTESLRSAVTRKPWRQESNRIKIESLIRPHFKPETIWPRLIELYRGISAGKI